MISVLNPLLGPLQIHAQQHLGPILRFGSARARMNRADGVELIVLARQQHRRFYPAYFMREPG